LNLFIQYRYVFKNISIYRYISKYILLVKKKLLKRKETGVDVYLMQEKTISQSFGIYPMPDLAFSQR